MSEQTERELAIDRAAANIHAQSFPEPERWSGAPIRKVRMLWEPRDLWVGVYWDRSLPLDMGWGFDMRTLHIYVCLIPCLPIKVTLSRVKSRKARAKR